MTALRWRKVLRELFESKGRSALVILSIAIGVLAFGGLLNTRTVMSDNLAYGYDTSNSYDIAFDLSTYDEPLIRWIERQPYVVDVQGLTVYMGDAVRSDGTSDEIQLTGIDDFSVNSINLITPEAGKFPPGKDEIVLERNSLTRYGYEIGDLITVELADQKPQALRIVGTVHDINTPMPVDSRTIKSFVQRDTLFFIGGDRSLNKLYITLDRAAMSAAGTELGNYADGLSEAMEKRGIGVRRTAANLENKHWAADNVTAMLTMLSIIGGVALAFSGFLVYNIISSFVTKQKRQIGVMKTIGASRSQIAWLFLTLVAMYGVLALCIALPLSFFMAYGISTALGSWQLNFDIDLFQPRWYVIALEVIMAILVPMLSSLVPVWQGTSMTVVEAINDNANQQSNSRLDRWLASLRLPRAWALALRNTFRRKLRLAMTLVTLVLAGSFFIGVLNLYTALPNDVRKQAAMESSDVRIVLSQPYLQRTLEAYSQRGENVVHAEGWLRSSGTMVKADGIETESYNIVGIPADSSLTRPLISSGRWLDFDKRGERYEIVVSDEIVLDHPVVVGETITLKHQDQSESWLVVGIIDTREPKLYVRYDTLSRWVNLRNQANEIHLKATAEDAATLAGVEQSLAAIYAEVGVEVNEMRNAAQIIADVIAVMSVLITLLLMVGTLIAIVGGLGLAGTMSLSVMERTREIGIMRSIGAGTGTLRQMLISEGMMVGVISLIFAWLFSFPVTTLLNSALGNIVFQRPVSFAIHPYAPLIWAALVLIVATLASLLPAHNATRISVREAIAYE